MRNRVGKGRAIGVAASAVVAALGVGGAVARAADRSFNVALVGHLNPLAGSGSTNNLYADLWGEGNLVALGSVGFGSGVTLINNTNPAAPTVYTRYMPPGTENGQFRDVIIRNGIGYFAIDSATSGTSTQGGVHVVDLSNPAAPVKRSVIKDPLGFINNHEMFLDGNFLYIASNRNRQLKIFDVSNPASPTHVQTVNTSGAATDFMHSVTVKNGRLYTSNLTNGITDIYDVSNLSTTTPPTLLGSLDVGTRNHSTWPSEDGKLLAVAREAQFGEVQLWNIENPAAPSLITSIHAANYGIDSFSAHNPVIIGDTLYVSWYQAGLQIFNIRNPSAPRLIGAFDTFVGGNGGPNAPGSFANGYDGNWGVDPFGGKSRILLSDFDNGFFTVDATNAFRKVWTYDGGPIHWQDDSRWDNGAGPFPDGSEMIAAFTNPAAGATRTVYVNSFFAPAVPRVAGMEFLSSLSYTIAGEGSGAIEMISSDGPARITVLANGATAGVNRVNAPIVLNDDLLVTNNANASAGTSLELRTIAATNRKLTFAGAGETALTWASPEFTGSVAVDGGRLVLRHAQSVNAQPITVSGGTLILRNDASTNYGSDLTVTGPMFLAVGSGGIGSGQTHALDDITVASGGVLKLVRNNEVKLDAADVSIAGALTVSQQGGGVMATRFDTLSIAAGGHLNLGESPLIVTSASDAAVEALVRRGHHGGAWDGDGIVTSGADALSGLTTLAVSTAERANRTTFGGFSVGGDDVLVMYTYAGDANLDGAITGDDYSNIDFGILFPGMSGYANGDFNYDGVITGDDYSVIDLNILLQGPPISAGAPAQPASPTTVTEVTPVPEPVGLGAALLTSAALISRRRRRTGFHL